MSTAQLLDLRPLYFADRSFVARAAIESRLADASKWVGALKQRTNLSVAARNQVLFDVVHLLADDWTEPKANAWNFIDVDELQAPLEMMRQNLKSPALAANSGSFLADIDELIDKARKDTPQSYADFVAKETARRQKEGEHFTDIEDYTGWYARYRPYLALDLSLPPELDDDAVEELIQQRIDFFISPLPEHSGWDGHFGNLARQFIDLKLISEERTA